MPKKHSVLWFLMLLPLVAVSQENDSVLAAITVEPIANNSVAISGICANKSSKPMELRYELIVLKSGKSGNTNNTTQSGGLFLDLEESKTVSTTTINFGKEDKAEIVLTIFDAQNVQIVQSKKWLGKTH